MRLQAQITLVIFFNDHDCAFTTQYWILYSKRVRWKQQLLATVRWRCWPSLMITGSVEKPESIFHEILQHLFLSNSVMIYSSDDRTFQSWCDADCCRYHRRCYQLFPAIPWASPSPLLLRQLCNNTTSWLDTERIGLHQSCWRRNVVHTCCLHPPKDAISTRPAAAGLYMCI